MTTHIELTPAPGRPRVLTKTGLLRPQVRAVTSHSAIITLVATGATLLGGDNVELRIVVGEGLTLDLADVAGTVAYDGRGVACRWKTSITVHPGGTLLWHGEPLVISSGAHVDRHTDIALADGARLLMRDTLALGRTGESGGDLSCRTRMTLGERPVLAEDLFLSAERRTWPGILGTAKVIDTVTALGWQPKAPASGTLRVFDLPCAGLMARALAPRAHLSDAPILWSAWRDSLPDAPT